MIVFDNRFIFIGIFTFLCLIFYADWVGIFAYDLGLIQQGQYWRLISGHFVHTSINHLLLNLVAFLLICIYGWSVLRPFEYTFALFFCAAMLSLSFMIFIPELDYYEGFSGILHSLIIMVTFDRIRGRITDYTAWIVLLFVITKLIYENIYGPSNLTQQLIHLPILTAAHVYGALIGALSVMLVWLWTYKKRKPGKTGLKNC